MPNFMEPAGPLYRHSSFVDATSRYMKSDILIYGDKRLLTFETYKRQKFVPTPQDRFYVITKGTEYRPDLVSYRSYGTVGFWWRIMEANHMSDILQFKVGTNIRIPAMVV